MALVGTTSTGPSRWELVRQALLDELTIYRSVIDGNADLSSVSLTVKLQDGPVPIRGVTYESETQKARRR